MGALRFLLVLVFLLPATVGHTAERLSNGYTQHPEAFFRAGFWYDPQDPGWGIDLHRSGGRLVATWATYDAEGHPVWYLGIGEPGAETWTLPLTRYTRDGESVSGEAVGQLEIEFDSGYQATMAWTLGEHSGSYRIEPLVVGDAPIAEDRTGYWYEADRPGYGMSISTQADWVLSVFLFYNDAGEPRWVWADNIETDESTRLRALTFSGPCPGCESSPVAATPAGNLNLRFRAENYAELDTNLVVETDQESFTWLTSNRVINLLSDRASGREQAFRLAQFTNEETLLSYLRIGMIDPGPYSYAAADAVFSPAPVAAEVSSTNLQVAGVDEADVVKTDGAHVYALDQFTPEPPTVRVLAMGDAGELVEINRLAAPEDRFINGLYLVNDRPDDRPDLLIMTFGRWDYHIFSEWFSPYPWATTDSGFRAFDVSDPAQPELVADVVLEGGTVETRRIGETLYIVSRAHIHDPAVAAAGSADQAVVAQALGPDDLLPAIRVNDQEALLVNAETTFLPPQPPGFRYPELLTVSAFDLSRPDDLPVTVTMAGLAEAVHVSRENLYVATSRFASSIDPAFDALTDPNLSFTDIHQFALADGEPRYAASGAVLGYLAWGGTSPSFSFSEHAGHLRVVTSGRFEHGEHRVSVLELDRDDGALAVRGFAPNDRRPERIGKPGELLYGVRFVEDRLYAVTFKNIDPLYVVDLSRPGDPKVLGELEVTGFSNYLHPLPGNLLLGFGKEAVPANTSADGNFAWYQGLQLSLFDVSEPLSPRLVRSVELGRRGSESAALYDHHAFTYLPPNPAAGRPARVALPVVIHDAAPGDPISENPSHFYDWQATGLATFDVFGSDGTAADLELRDVLITHDAETDPDRNFWQDGNATAARSILTDENIYFYLRGEFFSAPWMDQGSPLGPF